MFAILEKCYQFVWGIPALILIVSVGIYLCIRTGFAQIRLFPKAIHSFIKQLFAGKKEDGETSQFQALCTALAATVGTGNLAGVGGAIAIGGPGAVFWMWISALLGMMIKFAEATLSVHYRSKSPQGEWVSGPMYMAALGMPKRWHWIAGAYCFLGIVAAFGVGNATQINAVISGINDAVATYGGVKSKGVNVLIGCLVAFLIFTLLQGGAKRIGKITERLVPIAAAFYISLCVLVILLRFSYIKDAFLSILKGAFSPAAVTGGTVGSVLQSLRIGVSRGVFTNEAGLGTAAIAHGAASVHLPVEQGLMGIVEVFIDTIVICTLTALVILCSGISIPFGTDVGATLTTNAFQLVLGKWVCIPIAIALFLFAVATVLGWGLYGARCAQYLFGQSTWQFFVWVHAIAAILGASIETGTVWRITEIINGLMLIPNLIILVYLMPTLVKLTHNNGIKRNSIFSVQRLKADCTVRGRKV